MPTGLGSWAYAHRVASDPALRSHEQAARFLRRAGYPDEFITEVLGQLPDPIDLQRDQEILELGLGVPGRLVRSGRGARILSRTVVKSFCLGPAGWHSARRPLELAMSMATSGVAT